MNSKYHEFLNKQVKNDLKEFLPEGCFKLDAGFSVNGKALSWKEKSECMEAMYGNQICYESDCNTINLTPRQYAAAKVLYALGNLTDSEKTTTEAEEAIEDYLHFLSKQEKKPFISLLEDDLSIAGSIQRMNENRAFLTKCFNEGVEKNIDSVWLYIQNNAGTNGFLFETASKDAATKIDGKRVTKKNLGRCLSNLKKSRK